MMRRALWACIALAAAAAIAEDAVPAFTLKPLPIQTAGGAVILDVNRDELPDVFVANADGGRDLFLLQTLDGGWTKLEVPRALQPQARTDAVLAVDLNRDATPDLVLVRAGRLQILLNEVSRLRDVTPANLAARPADGAITTFVTAADVNGDGWIDLYEGRRYPEKTGAPGRLWLNRGKLNNGAPQFQDAGATSGLGASRDVLQALFLDLDNDGDQDLVTLEGAGRLNLWENLGKGAFRHRPLTGLGAANGPWRVIAAADYDNDGRMDLFLTAAATAGGKPALLHNDGGLSFKPVNLGVDKAVGTAAVWLDADNDGLLDLAVAGDPSRLLRQTLEGFVEAGVNLPPATGLAVVDLDRNGFADLILLKAPGQTPGLTAARNRGGAYHWLSVRLRARANAATLGAKVVVYLPDGTHMLRQDLAFGGHTDHDHELLFGVGRRTQIDGVRIYWPSGKFTQLEDVGLDRHIGFLEPSDASGGRTVHQRLPLELWKRPGSPILLCN